MGGSLAPSFGRRHQTTRRVEEVDDVAGFGEPERMRASAPAHVCYGGGRRWQGAREQLPGAYGFKLRDALRKALLLETRVIVRDDRSGLGRRDGTHKERVIEVAGADLTLASAAGDPTRCARSALPNCPSAASIVRLSHDEGMPYGSSHSVSGLATRRALL